MRYIFCYQPYDSCQRYTLFLFAVRCAVRCTCCTFVVHMHAYDMLCSIMMSGGYTLSRCTFYFFHARCVYSLLSCANDNTLQYKRGKTEKERKKANETERKREKVKPHIYIVCRRRMEVCSLLSKVCTTYIYITVDIQCSINIVFIVIH